MLINSIAILILFILCNQSPDYNQIKKLYKESDIVFTGYLSTSFINTANNSSKSYILEFDLTEIQKGYRRNKVLINNFDSDSLIVGQEYLIFVKQNKEKDRYFNTIIQAYKVCPDCSNKEIITVYQIVKNKPFKRIKSPVSRIKINSGCNCR